MDREKPPGYNERALDLGRDFEAEYAEYTREARAEMTIYLQQKVSDKSIDSTIAERELLRLERKFSEASPTTRANMLMNNFHANWPGGYYHDMLAQEEAGGVNEPDHVTKKELIAAINQIIIEKGWEDIAERIGKKDATLPEEESLRLQAEVFMTLRKHGWDRQTLRA